MRVLIFDRSTNPAMKMIAEEFFSIFVGRAQCKKVCGVRQLRLADVIKSDVVISPSTSVFNPLLGLICRVFRKRFYVGIHDVEAHEEADRAKVFIYNWILCRLSDVVVFSKFSQRRLLEVFGKQALLYYFGVPDAIEFDGDKDIDVLMYGRIQSYQGIQRLPKILSLMENEKVVLAGKGFSGLSWQSENVTVIGRFLTSRELDDFRKRSKVVILPYVSATQSGIIPEGMSVGCVPVVTDVGALREQVYPLDTCVKDYTAELFVKKVRMVLENREDYVSLLPQSFSSKKAHNNLFIEKIMK